MVRTFVVYGTRARGDGKFTLKDLPGSGGRMDVIARSITSAFLLSDDMRRDVEMYVLFGGNDEHLLMHIDGSGLRNLNPDERSTVHMLKKYLSAYSSGLPGGSDFRNRINRSDDLRAVVDDAERFFGRAA